jgi:Mn2+/Fe2+ NRAMP family transporter
MRDRSLAGKVGGTAPHAKAASGPKIIQEDVKRALDRRRVQRLRMHGGRGRGAWLLWLLIGPGILAMLGENDAPSMLSYAQTGASYGIGFFLPFVLLTFGMAYVVQEMTVRLGVATHRGHAELIFDRFGLFWGWFAMGDLFLSNIFTLVTEFIGIRVGLGFFGVPPGVAVLGGFLVVAGTALTRRYWTWERITLGLAAFNLIFVPVAILTHPVGTDVIRSFFTWGPLPGGISKGWLLLVVADIGATVTPWMLFFQQGAVVDKGMTQADIRQGRMDTAIGALVAALAAIATIIATTPLFIHSVNPAHLTSGADFAQALRPYVGNVGATLFAVGIFEAGLVAAIAISSSSAYAFGEVTHRFHSLNSSWKDGWPFYVILMLSAGIAAILVLIPNAPLEFIVLIVNVFATLAMPPALVFLVLLVNDREIMGAHASGRLGNVLAIGVTVFLVIVGLIFGITTVFPHLLPG